MRKAKVWMETHPPSTSERVDEYAKRFGMSNTRPRTLYHRALRIRRQGQRRREPHPSWLWLIRNFYEMFAPFDSFCLRFVSEETVLLAADALTCSG